MRNAGVVKWRELDDGRVSNLHAGVADGPQRREGERRCRAVLGGQFVAQLAEEIAGNVQEHQDAV